MGVFVTDGDQRASLAVVRALGSAGIPVTVGSDRSGSLAASSRYCGKSVRYPSPRRQPEQFQAFLRTEMSSGQYRALIPITDLTVQLTAGCLGALQPLVRVPIAEQTQIRFAQDKGHMLQLAHELDIPCPQTFVLRPGESVEELSRQVQFPVVIKPRFSWTLREGTWIQGPVQYARTPDELVERYCRIHEQVPYPLIQERIDGPGEGVFLLIWDGKLRAAFCHRRLREKPPSGGVSVYRESVPLNQDLVEKSLRLLLAIGWSGVAMVEFKTDLRDGLSKFMEVNGRFWGSLQLALDAGVNFPLMLYQLACGEDVPSPPPYKVGVRSRWLLGDFDHLLLRLRKSSSLNGRSAIKPGRVQAVFEFLKLFERDLHYEVLRWEDPVPGFVELQHYVRALLGQTEEAHER